MRMVESWPDDERELALSNLSVVCDAEVSKETLTLSEKGHMDVLIASARRCNPDLIVIDTMAALFPLFQENDNAEVSRRVMRPLARLAKETDAGVLLLHHFGKASEDAQSGVRAYRGRGASASGAAARLVLLMAPDKNEPALVMLSCAKSKGDRFPDTLLRLGPDRWFRDAGQAKLESSTGFDLVVETVSGAERPVRRMEVETLLKGKVSKSAVGKGLVVAVRTGALVKLKHGLYAAPENAPMLAHIGDEQTSTAAVTKA